MPGFDLPWRQISTQGEEDPHGEEPAQAGVSNHEAPRPILRDAQTRAPQDEVQIVEGHQQVARMERSAIRERAEHQAPAPDFAEPVIGRRFAPTRWLHPGYFLFW